MDNAEGGADGGDYFDMGDQQIYEGDRSSNEPLPLVSCLDRLILVHDVTLCISS
jgi:hypothetical protein